jgi:hypothetical protein
VGYVPDEDSDPVDGIFRDGCCRPEYKARPGARCFTPLLGSRLPKTLVCETDPSDRARVSLGLQAQMGRRQASGILRTRSRLLLGERA